MKNFSISGWACQPDYFDTIVKSRCLDWSFYDEAEMQIESFSKELESCKQDFVLIGYSLGSLLALDYATQFKNCKGLILLSPFASFCGSGRKARLLERQIKLMIQGIESQPAKTVQQFQLKSGSPPITPSSYNQKNLRIGLEWLINKSFTNKPPKIPSLLIRGQQDQIVSEERFQELAELLPDAQIIELEQGQHDLSHDTQVKTIVNRFLETLA